jgi:Recombination endonuclease VII
VGMQEIDQCRGCGKPKSPETFGSYLVVHGPDKGQRKLRARCRECLAKRNGRWRAENRDKWLVQARDSARRSRKRNPETHFFWEIKKKYGITKAEYLAMLAAQNARCAACFRLPAEGKRLGVDHCHRTGAVRGLLCSHCNTALGQVDDSIERLRMLIFYLGG